MWKRQNVSDSEFHVENRMLIVNIFFKSLFFLLAASAVRRNTEGENVVDENQRGTLSGMQGLESHAFFCSSQTSVFSQFMI